MESVLVLLLGLGLVGGLLVVLQNVMDARR